ncbi:hypothetical protein C2S53_012268 [Perilla frutescens var. hirtella]|uniref:Uncharacterized protein n=1 Tax=Perilla frutescens var. hirtella TaxID=608512 RepID=A0AAD4J341_PERFH|nr:hypothetical protein C2S53_012268 [Perilla frutescens var. hirtella]
MKRVSGNVENEELGSKKVKFFNEVDDNFVDLDRNEGEEEGVLAENGAGDSAQVDRNGNLFGEVVPDNLVGPSFGGVEGEGSNIWDFDINFDMIFGNEEEQRGLFDLNFPVYNKYPNRRKGLLEYNKFPMVDKKEKEIVDLVSDDDDSEVEIIGYTHGYNSKDKQIESGMPSDRVENLGLGLGLLSMENGVGGSNLVTGGEWRYTSEEKGKASDMDSWLSLKASYFVDLDLETDSDESVRSIEPLEEVDVVPWQPVVLVARSEMVERVQQAELEYRRNTARRLARINISDQNSGNQSSSQKQQPPTHNPIEQLGKLPGPFSDALKMVRERTSKRSAQQLIEWRPSVKNQEQSITAAFVPSLLDLSLNALAKSAEGIVSLEQVPDNIRGRLANKMCDIGKMNAFFLNLLVEGCPTEIRIKNCSWLTEDQFQQTIGNCQTKDLQVLQLDLCGQCMLDIAFRKILDRCSGSFSKLAIVSLRGACRLSDNGLRIFIESAPVLRSINLGQCTLLTSDAIIFIADLLGSDLRELYIDECPKIDAMRILPVFKKFRYLEVLSVAGIHAINDHFVSEIVAACGQSLKELDFANCLQLTDDSLKAIGKSCADLCSLNISNLNKLTDLGIEALANGCKSIQKLKLCRNEFSDEAVAAFLESSGESLLELLLNNMAKVGPHTALSLAKRSRKLLNLDISWCRGITNEALGLIVDSCSSLKLLKIFGCRQITRVFLEGHSNRLVRIIGTNFTPIMDHLDLLEPEEMFLRYSPLPVFMEH